MFIFDAVPDLARISFRISPARSRLRRSLLRVLIGGLGTPEAGYSINTEFRLRIPPALSCSSRWSAPRRALIKFWFKAARNFRAVWEPAERRVSHGLRSNSRMTPPWDIEHVAVRASPLMRLT